MTGSMQPKVAMRHIPEEELHAYLDQGLSRSQCVEIESHLAACPACQSERDSIAALRDRPTALLAKLAPPALSHPQPRPCSGGRRSKPLRTGGGCRLPPGPRASWSPSGSAGPRTT